MYPVLLLCVLYHDDPWFGRQPTTSASREFGSHRLRSPFLGNTKARLTDLDEAQRCRLPALLNSCFWDRSFGGRMSAMGRKRTIIAKCQSEFVCRTASTRADYDKRSCYAWLVAASLSPLSLR